MDVIFDRGLKIYHSIFKQMIQNFWNIKPEYIRTRAIFSQPHTRSVFHFHLSKKYSTSHNLYLLQENVKKDWSFEIYIIWKYVWQYK
jgi:hypothetical protein